MSDVILPEARVCNACGMLKPITDYHRNPSSKGGRLPRCKACRKLADQPYIEAHREESRNRAKEWSKANPVKERERSRRWAKSNPEARKAITARYRSSRKGQLGAQAWLKKRDRQARRAAASRYYLKNRDRYRNGVRNRRAKLRGAKGSHTKEDVALIAKRQGMRCVYCRKRLIGSAYDTDHIFPLHLGGSNDKGNLQVLCPTCNRKKGAKHPVEYANRLGLLF